MPDRSLDQVVGARGTRYGAVDVKRAADLYNQGWTVRQIGAELGVHWSTGSSYRQPEEDQAGLHAPSEETGPPNAYLTIRDYISVSTGVRVARAALLGPRLTTILIDLPTWMPRKR